MKSIILAVAVALLNSSLATYAGESSPLKAHPNSKAWVALFAADLSNAVFPAGVWSWKDGELTPKDKDEAIWSKKEYENFILDLEFNLASAANSVVFVYNSDMQNWIPNTVEIQLLDDPAPKWAKHSRATGASIVCIIRPSAALSRCVTKSRSSEKRPPL